MHTLAQIKVRDGVTGLDEGVYAMGMRNPFRITTDPRSGALMVADYGPDARQSKADRGPEGTATAANTPTTPAITK